MESTPVFFPGMKSPVRVLLHRAERHDFSTWESCWLPRLVASVTPGSVVFDVGAEQGEFGALAAFLGAKVHLFEPSTTSWAAIRGIFEANDLKPAGAFHGFAASVGNPRQDEGAEWPQAAYRPLQSEVDFFVLHERPDIRQVSLDGWALAKNAWPDVVMIDVEGAEVHVVLGMREILMRKRPKVFVSIHPPEFLSRFTLAHPALMGGRKMPAQQEHLFRLFAELGYVGEFLGEDHESHWLFERRG